MTALQFRIIEDYPRETCASETLVSCFVLVLKGFDNIKPQIVCSAENVLDEYPIKRLSGIFKLL